MFAYDYVLDRNENESTAPAATGLSDIVRLVLLWHIMKLLYRISIYALMRFYQYHNPQKTISCSKTDRDRDSNCNSNSSESHNRQQHCRIQSFVEVCCPHKRARFYKCAARRHQQQQYHRNHRPCCLKESAVHLAKLTLPPPLPFHKRRKRQCKRSTSTGTVETATTTSLEEDHSNHSREEDLVVRDNMKVLEETATTVATTAAVVYEANELTVNRITTSSPGPSKVQRQVTPTHGGVALIDQARMQFWDTILQQAEQGHIRKRGVRHRDSDGLNSLHWTCAGSPPVEVVQAMLRIHPSVAHKVDNDGSTALHFATHYAASLAVIQTLLQANPEAIRVQDCHGRSPLYHAVEKRAGLDMLQALIQEDPSMIIVPCLPTSIREQLQQQQQQHSPFPLSRAMAARTPLFLAWSTVIMDRQARKTTRGKLWDKAQVLLEAAYRQQQVSNNNNKKVAANYKYNFLQAAITMDLYLPDQVLGMAIESQPQQLRIPDQQTGRLALAQAAASTQYCLERTHIVLKALLEAHPEAAVIADRYGDTPLRLAAKSGKPWSSGGRGILELLFQAHPQAVVYSTDLPVAFLAASAASFGSTAAEESGDKNNNIDMSNDPFGLLLKNDKHHQWIQRRQMSLPLDASSSDQVHTVTASREEHLETVFQLIRADPSIVG